MAVLAECPICHKKQTLRNKVCTCSADLEKAKKSDRLNYWIVYRLPGGKQKWESVGCSIKAARDADGKRRVQKRENRIFDIKQETRMTFKELADWYLNLESVKAIKTYSTVQNNLNRFNSVFGSMIVSQIKPADLKNYQAKRKSEGFADKTVDDQIVAARAVINAAEDNDMISGDIRKNFKKVKKLLKKNANARKKILPVDQFNRLMEHLPLHDKWTLATAFYTGMRFGEIVRLTWDKVSLQNRVIRLEAGDTKDKEAREIPICDELYAILDSIPKAIHDKHVFLYRGVNGKKIGRPFKNIKTALTNACRKAGIPYGRFTRDGFVFHDLRHTFNTYMRKAGVDSSVIMEITGHSTREMFDRYNTVDQDDRREAMKRMEGFLRVQAENVSQNVNQVAISGV